MLYMDGKQILSRFRFYKKILILKVQFLAIDHFLQL